MFDTMSSLVLLMNTVIHSATLLLLLLLTHIHKTVRGPAARTVVHDHVSIIPIVCICTNYEEF